MKIITTLQFKQELAPLPDIKLEGKLINEEMSDAKLTNRELVQKYSFSVTKLLKH